ncbi:MAG: hypothetical protein ACOVSW_14785 [Candidatus Kapaibacteriota bacterium]
MLQKQIVGVKGADQMKRFYALTPMMGATKCFAITIDCCSFHGNIGSAHPAQKTLVERCGIQHSEDIPEGILRGDTRLPTAERVLFDTILHVPEPLRQSRCSLAPPMVSQRAISSISTRGYSTFTAWRGSFNGVKASWSESIGMRKSENADEIVLG